MNVRPLHDRLLVRRIEEKETVKGGIIIPDTAKEKPQEGEVIAVGNGKVLENGTKVPLDVKAGDKILFGKYSGTEIKIDGEEYLILREDEVLGGRRLVRLTKKRRSATHGEADHVRRRVPAGDPARREPPGRRGEGHPRPQGPQRRPRQEVRLPRDHQGRRDRRQGDRARGPAREHGRADGARGRLQDLRRGRRRHHHRDRARRRRSSARASRTSPRAPTRWSSSAASTRP